MTPNQVTDVKQYDIIMDHDDPESSDELDSDEEECMLDEEVEKAELEAVEALRQTKARIADLNRKNLIREEAWISLKNADPAFCDDIELFKTDPRWTTLSAIVSADYEGFLTDCELEMITLKHFSDEEK
jgi:hypothetical protein